MKKNFPHLPLFKLCYFALLLALSGLVNAALVQIDPHADFPVQPSIEIKALLNTDPERPKPKGDYRSNDYKIDTPARFHLPSNAQQAQHKPKLYDLKAQGKKLINDYQDNELLSKTLNSLSQAKQLWTDADALATDFAYDLFFSLELDQLIQSEISITPALQNIEMGSSTQKTQEIPIHTRQASTINYNTLLEEQANTAIQGTDHLTNFLHSLLHITTLYYLAALLILVSFLQWLIPFLLRLFP